MARPGAEKRPTFAAKGSTLCGQTSVLVWLNAVRALRAWKQTVAILVAPPVVTIILVLLQLLANVVVDKEGEAPRGSGCGSCAENGLPAAPLFALGSALPRCGAAVPTPCAPLPRDRFCGSNGAGRCFPCSRAAFGDPRCCAVANRVVPATV